MSEWGFRIRVTARTPLHRKATRGARTSRIALWSGRRRKRSSIRIVSIVSVSVMRTPLQVSMMAKLLPSRSDLVAGDEGRGADQVQQQARELRGPELHVDEGEVEQRGGHRHRERQEGRGQQQHAHGAAAAEEGAEAQHGRHQGEHAQVPRAHEGRPGENRAGQEQQPAGQPGRAAHAKGAAAGDPSGGRGARPRAAARLLGEVSEGVKKTPSNSFSSVGSGSKVTSGPKATHGEDRVQEPEPEGPPARRREVGERRRRGRAAGSSGSNSGRAVFLGGVGFHGVDSKALGRRRIAGGGRPPAGRRAIGRRTVYPFPGRGAAVRSDRGSAPAGAKPQRARRAQERRRQPYGAGGPGFAAARDRTLDGGRGSGRVSPMNPAQQPGQLLFVGFEGARVPRRPGGADLPGPRRRCGALRHATSSRRLSCGRWSTICTRGRPPRPR